MCTHNLCFEQNYEKFSVCLNRRFRNGKHADHLVLLYSLIKDFLVCGI